MATTMEQITLIDAETNIEYKLVISTEDAKKARNENIDNTNEITPCSSETDSSVEVKDQHIWTRSETMLLINLYKEHIAKFNSPKSSSKQCWNIVSKEMKDAGYNIPPIKCATKFQCLKRTYKSVTDHNKKSGNSRKHWEYYKIY
ncbi:uncharacterized protein LOC109862949 isoform X2 [Pseudomyrmex gracilis]|uniref:uncharacterized protein LOC109862949 isoform X2 n=1 Tax=Pseudomyrmex gracilis TaxID=219809 RepID=UPI0009957E41|nr:uncharacterized protein LOC109862949 isoform X2 [Pseudomyrmex gracilis]